MDTTMSLTARLAGVIPNSLSLARLTLGVCFPWLPPSWRVPAVVLAALSDLGDGASGRYLNATSDAGRALDPIADKVFVLALLATIIREGTLALDEALLLGLRDLVVIAGSLVAVALHDWAVFTKLTPTLLSKITTAAQFLFLFALLLDLRYLPLFLVTVLASALAGLDYLRIYIAHLRA